MKKAFIILAHQLPQQLNIFINQLLADPENDIFVHVNKKNEQMKNEIIKNERVFVSQQNIEVTWGSDSILKALLIMLRQVKETGQSYKYILICSGQDLLVKDGLDKFLGDNYGKFFIYGYEDDKKRRAFLLHKWPDRYRQLIDNKLNPIMIIRRLRLELFKLGFPLEEKKVNYDVSSVTFYENLFWCAMPDFIFDYILDFLDKNPGFWEIYDNALVPEEAFFSTIVMNSKHKDCIDYTNGKSQSLTYDKRKGGHSTLITSNDIEDIEKSDKFFARKFDITKDKEAVDYFAHKII